MKLLAVVILCVYGVCAKRKDRFIIGGTVGRDDDYGKAMAYVSLGQGYCSGVCISNRMVLTCGKCSLDDTSKLTVKVGVSKSTEDGGGVREVRYTTDKEIAMVITKAEMTTCKPLKIACTKTDVPEEGEYTTLYGWGMTSMSSEDDPDTVQMVDMKWATNDTGCKQVYPSITTNTKKYICMQPNKNPKPTQTTCFGDCGGPAIKEDKVVGIIIRSSSSCTPGTPTVVASIYPKLFELLGSSGAGEFMLDFATTTTDKGPATAVDLPYSLTEKGCIPMNAKMAPDATAPGDCKGKMSTKDYGKVEKGAACEELAQQLPGYALRKKNFRCKAGALNRANGCKCCTRGIVTFRCYKCGDD